MRRIALGIALALALTGATAAFAADPAISVETTPGGVLLRLEGSYAGAWYRVFRSGGVLPAFMPLTASNVLCTGECILEDTSALPGRSYQYRFDVIAPAGLVSYGPYTITIPDRALAARVSPNPGAGVARVELSVPGATADGPVNVEVRVIDLQGRAVRTLFKGAAAPGLSTFTWDGRGDGGRALPGGLYFLLAQSPHARSATRIIRTN